MSVSDKDNLAYFTQKSVYSTHLTYLSYLGPGFTKKCKSAKKYNVSFYQRQNLLASNTRAYFTQKSMYSTQLTVWVWLNSKNANWQKYLMSVYAKDRTYLE